jgi:hypothetical protein
VAAVAEFRVRTPRTDVRLQQPMSVHTRAMPSRENA